MFVPFRVRLPRPCLTPHRPPVPLCMFCGLLWLAVLTGCTAGMTPEGHGIPASRAVTLRREYLPPFSGQTIRPPQRMADVATLWMPLTREEQIRLAAYGDVSACAPPAACFSAAAWLPPSEQGLMREYVYRLTVSQKTVTGRVLARAARLLPMIAAILKEQSLPPELAALPLVESAFEPQAVSPAGAAGLWQLMPATARRFGLTVDASCDERFDPRRSTEAAARYLRWLNGHFRDWPLALAAYNCGEGAMTGFLRQCGARSLGELSVAGRDIVPQETLCFVPKFVAAASVMLAGGHISQGNTTAPGPSPRPSDRQAHPVSSQKKAPLPARPSGKDGAPIPKVPAMRRISR